MKRYIIWLSSGIALTIGGGFLENLLKHWTGGTFLGLEHGFAQQAVVFAVGAGSMIIGLLLVAHSVYGIISIARGRKLASKQLSSRDVSGS